MALTNVDRVSSRNRAPLDLTSGNRALDLTIANTLIGLSIKCGEAIAPKVVLPAVVGVHEVVMHKVVLPGTAVAEVVAPETAEAVISQVIFLRLQHLRILQRFGSHKFILRGVAIN